MLISLIFLSVNAIEWILDPGHYFSSKDLSSSYYLGFMWGTEYKLNHEITEDHIHLSVPYADPGRFYIQKASDSKLNLDLTQTWLIGQDGWEMTLEATQSKKKIINLVFFLAISDGFLEYNQDKWEGSFPFSFETPASPVIRAIKTSDISEKSWKVKKFVQKWLYDSHISSKAYGKLTAAQEKQSNFIFIQVQTSADFYFKIKFGKTENQNKDFFISEFSAKYLKSFGESEEFLQNILGYLLSGLAYLKGPIKVKKLNKVESGHYNELLTFVPSRSSFPRGFLWDEGFHLLVVDCWNRDLALRVLKNWISVMDENGWIAREQIRGPAAETRVPEQFIAQSAEIANPPSFVFLIENLVDYLNSLNPDSLHSDSAYQTLSKIYPKLKTWLFWIINTQKNDEELPMWKGRTAGHNLASGLDDYPRGLQPNEKERHLDLYMWELKFAQTLKSLSLLLDNREDFLILERTLQKLLSIKDSFLDNGLLKDYLGEQFIDSQGRQGYYWRGDNQCGTVLNPLGTPAECNPYSDVPCCSEFGWCGNTPGHCQCEKCKKSEKLEQRKNLKKSKIFSPHFGYVNLMPLIIGHAQDLELENIFNLIEDEDLLWSQFGLRSLARSDLLFKSGENYWKGEIWMNFNFMVLRGIKKYYWEMDRARGVYERLRENVIKTVKNSWEDTKYVWEQYSEEDGKGKRVHPFAGWSSLILNIYYEKY